MIDRPRAVATVAESPVRGRSYPSGETRRDRRLTYTGIGPRVGAPNRYLDDDDSSSLPETGAQTLRCNTEASAHGTRTGALRGLRRGSAIVRSREPRGIGTIDHLTPCLTTPCVIRRGRYLVNRPTFIGDHTLARWRSAAAALDAWHESGGRGPRPTRPDPAASASADLHVATSLVLAAVPDNDRPRRPALLVRRATF